MSECMNGENGIWTWILKFWLFIFLIFQKWLDDNTAEVFNINIFFTNIYNVISIEKYKI